jgi:2-polyprenyl-3-methyl-5-hydroxy-6-metoxy-1,4-benzoquinol methylase
MSVKSSVKSTAVEAVSLEPPRCRFCGTALAETFIDLGVSPPSNSYLSEADLRRMEPFFPLHAYVCEGCFLVQLDEFQSPEEIFGHYRYFSSFSQSWLRHAETYADAMMARFSLGPRSQVVEVASNDGYLLQYFHRRGIPVLGIEPAINVARAAEEKGITTLVRFFGINTARSVTLMGKQADLLIGNNVLAHVPDLNGFAAGLKIALKPEGVLTLEFPHLLKLMAFNQFDTIYHEHFSYFSLLTAGQVFARHGLRVFDVEELPTHGGSLRVFVCHEGAAFKDSGKAEDLLARECEAGLDRIETYRGFGENVRRLKRDLLRFLINAKEQGKTTVGYGAPAKGNTLLNYCGIGTDLLDYTVDASPHKQGLYLPGSRIPIYAPGRIAETKPDYVLILPWNLKDEIMAQMAHVHGWGGQFVLPVPVLSIVD